MIVYQCFLAVAGTLTGSLCVGCDLNVDVHCPWKDDGRACLAWDSLQEHGFGIQSTGVATWKSTSGTERTLDYILTRLARPFRLASEPVVVTHLRDALPSDHHCVSCELTSTRRQRRARRQAATFSVGCGRWSHALVG